MGEGRGIGDENGQGNKNQLLFFSKRTIIDLFENTKNVLILICVDNDSQETIELKCLQPSATPPAQPSPSRQPFDLVLCQ